MAFTPSWNFSTMGSSQTEVRGPKTCLRPSWFISSCLPFFVHGGPSTLVTLDTMRDARRSTLPLLLLFFLRHEQRSLVTRPALSGDVVSRSTLDARYPLLLFLFLLRDTADATCPRGCCRWCMVGMGYGRYCTLRERRSGNNHAT